MARLQSLAVNGIIGKMTLDSCWMLLFTGLELSFLNYLKIWFLNVKIRKTKLNLNLHFDHTEMTQWIGVIHKLSGA